MFRPESREYSGLQKTADMAVVTAHRLVNVMQRIENSLAFVFEYPIRRWGDESLRVNSPESLSTIENHPFSQKLESDHEFKSNPSL